VFKTIYLVSLCVSVAANFFDVFGVRPLPELVVQLLHVWPLSAGATAGGKR